jgi:hypothetical protein
LNEIVQDIVHAFPGGRLFRYNEKKDELDIITENLYYPNGVQLLPDKNSVLVNEFSMARILKIQLSGWSKGKKELFTELPGLSDAIRLTPHQTLLVPFVAVFPTTASFMNYLGQYSILRSFIGFVNYF